MASYFHVNGGSQVKIPKSLYGYQHAKSGEAYAGIKLMVQSSDLSTYKLKNYIEVELKEELTKGQSYCAEFYYSMTDEAVNNPIYYPQELGMLFTDTLVKRASGIGTDQPQNICATPQVKAMMGSEYDSVNWIKVSGYFKAKGGERFLTIGSFNKLDTLIGYVWTAIFIDDVSVVACDSGGTGDTVKPPSSFEIYPVPAIDYLTIEHQNGSLQGYTLELYDLLGRKVYGRKFNQEAERETLFLPHLRPGMYLYRIRKGEIEIQTGKLVLL